MKLPGRLAIVWRSWKPGSLECLSSLLTTHPISCQSSWNTKCWATILSTGCLFSGTAFQVSNLKTSADNPNTNLKKGGNPWPVLSMPNKVDLYSKIATVYLRLQRLKRLKSLFFKIPSLCKVEIQVSESGH